MNLAVVMNQKLEGKHQISVAAEYSPFLKSTCPLGLKRLEANNLYRNPQSPISYPCLLTGRYENRD